MGKPDNINSLYKDGLETIRNSPFITGNEAESSLEYIARAAVKGTEFSDLEKLRSLTGAYIDMCGVSAGARTVIFDCGQRIFERMCRENEPISKAQHHSWVSFMPFLHEEYTKEKYDKYDIIPMDMSEYAESLFELRYELSDTDRVMPALAEGFLLLCGCDPDAEVENDSKEMHLAYQHYDVVLADFRDWVNAQRSGEPSEREEPTWQDISIIADTPLTREFADYIHGKGFAHYDDDILSSCNLNPDDIRTKEYLAAIVKEGLDWKVFDSFSLTDIWTKLSDGTRIRLYAQSMLFPTDSTPVVRVQVGEYHKSQPGKHFNLILRIDGEKPAILSRSKDLEESVVGEITSLVASHRKALMDHWNNEIDAIELISQIKGRLL